MTDEEKVAKHKLVGSF